jgi:hypothetical protein
MIKTALYLGLCASLTASVGAFAHHSMSMFDRDKIIMLDGTVKDFQWTNPHSWLDVMVPDGKGGSVEWGLELGSLNQLQRTGWKPVTLKPGDKIKVTLHPLKNGDPGGMLADVTMADGKVLSVGGGGNPNAVN